MSLLAPRASALVCEWRPLAELAALTSAWRDLAARAVEPNVFYEPAFALNAAPALGSGVGAVVVWSPDGRLLGLFPLRISRRRYTVSLPLLVGWTHPYAPLGTPLVDRDALADTVAAFVDHVANDPDLPDLLLLPYLASDGAVAAAFAQALAERGGQWRAFGTHRRALLRSTVDGDTYLTDALGKKKRRELARQRRRLADGGDLIGRFETAPSGVARMLAEFLALEAVGWKGRAGTAAAQNTEVTRFMAGAVAGLATEGKALLVGLHQGDHPLAACLVLKSGTGAWAWKIAYDEAAARGSPGVQIIADITTHLLADKGVAWCDSCATPDHTMIDHIWRERLAIEDRLMALTPTASFAFASRLEALRRGLIATGKDIRDRLRVLTARGA